MTLPRWRPDAFDDPHGFIDPAPSIPPRPLHRHRRLFFALCPPLQPPPGRLQCDFSPCHTARGRLLFASPPHPYRPPGSCARRSTAIATPEGAFFLPRHPTHAAHRGLALVDLSQSHRPWVSCARRSTAIAPPEGAFSLPTSKNGSPLAHLPSRGSRFYDAPGAAPHRGGWGVIGKRGSIRAPTFPKFIWLLFNSSPWERSFMPFGKNLATSAKAGNFYPSGQQIHEREMNTDG